MACLSKGGFCWWEESSSELWDREMAMPCDDQKMKREKINDETRGMSTHSYISCETLFITFSLFELEHVNVNFVFMRIRSEGLSLCHITLLYHFILTGYIFADGPGIENFQICGDAIPGEKLLGCGYPVRGTSLCMFQVKFFLLVFNFSLIFFLSLLKLMSSQFLVPCQWVRHLEDGTRQYIEGG